MSEKATLEKRFAEIRARDFTRLDRGGHTYLDYTGSGLYAESQLRSHMQFLQDHVLGNPHSENPASAAATRLVESTRERVLEFFNADPDVYQVVFTANASAALKLVGEAYPFEATSRFVLLRDNHNSVNGIRSYARARGAEVSYIDLSRDLRIAPGERIPPAGEGPSLFAYPAQSNFSGVQHPLALVEEAHALGYDVVLDAAAFVPTNPVDVSAVGPDYMCVSFYKMFGFPTGVGALIARTDALHKLHRPWFAGGTVEYVSVQSEVHRLRNDAGAFEDGTPNFLAIAGIPSGLDFLESVGMDALHEHVLGLTSRLLEMLTELHHGNGRPVVDVYGPLTTEARGGTVAFNVLDPEGRVVPFGVVEREASEENISLRGGCFCNPGAAEVAFGLPASETLDCLQAQPWGAFNLKDLSSCLGRDLPVGAMRASLGIATDHADLDRLAAFLRRYVDRPVDALEAAAAR